MSNPQAAPFIGSKISLISRSEIRYEGILYTIDTKESTVALQNVRSFGTEGRKKDGEQIPPSNEVYDYIIFRGADIKDLHVAEAPAPLQSRPPQDPAIISSQGQQKIPPYQSGFGPQFAPGQFPPMPSYQQFGQNGQFQGYPPMYPPQYGNFPQPVVPQQPPVSTTPTQQAAAAAPSTVPKSSGAPTQQPTSGSALDARKQGPENRQHQNVQLSHNQAFQRSAGNRNRPRNASESKSSDGQQQQQQHQAASGQQQHAQRGGHGSYRGSGQRRGGGGNAGNGNAGGVSGGRGYFNGSALRPQAAPFQDEFDLEAANAKFDKMKIFEEVQTHLAQSQPSNAISSHAGDASASEPAAEPAVVIVPAAVSYDKQKSFFDNISCDAKDRATDRDQSRPRVTQADQRRLDQLTFGADAARGRSRGRGRGRGYGGPSRYPPSQQIHQMKAGGFQGQRGRGSRGGRSDETSV
eukprot:TRINITY_DN994_c0_g1_i1.p1 TRINITY_DN994_c0_g1~~TRINITY_DN994_c0_g1_i1.p1  ORF type:complete len:464 (+),score=38.96 TRINITY_DN994_c0_g1_i1:107-1498(+)